MTGSGRLRMLAVSVVVLGLVLLAGAQAWATVRHAGAGCDRPAAATGHSGAAAGPRGTSAVRGVAARQGPRHPAGDHASWRGRMLRAAGCQAWREIRSHRHHYRASGTAAPSALR
jgi:hypothetical protein